MRKTFAVIALLGLAICPVPSSAETVARSGPSLVVDGVEDAGNGIMRVSWSLQFLANRTYAHNHPEKVCVGWKEVVDGVLQSGYDEACFTSEMSSQADLNIDTGLGADGPTTEYALAFAVYYGGAMNQRDDWWQTRIVMNE